MDLPSKEIFDILIDKGVKSLYHANTVCTSKTFLKNGGILSRKYIEQNGLIQTHQISDEIDKKFNIWDNIFLDAINISNYFSRYNGYGPILFQFYLDLLKSDKLKTLRITKKNPIYWKEKESLEERYFITTKDFNEKFKSGNKLLDAGYHILLTTLNGLLSFEYLEVIQIDEPGFYSIDEKGEKKLVSQMIIENFSEDLERNGISKEKVIINNNLILRLQYRMLSRFNKKEYKRLFDTKIE